jgi:hypothetical protein
MDNDHFPRRLQVLPKPAVSFIAIEQQIDPIMSI